jgi:uncharacterized protein (TIGR01777 family)
MTQRVVVVGATGRIGRPLCRELIRAGHTVVVFSRDPGRARRLVPDAADYVAWSPDRLPTGCAGHLERADAVVYLAGGPPFDGRRHGREDVLAESRARKGALGQLVAAWGGLDRRPGALIAASSVGYYGYAGRSDTPVDETRPAGADWWGRDSAAIEEAALAAEALGVRTVLLRTGYVLTPGSLSSQVARFGRHFGGWVGSGRGWTSWIHIADEVGIIAFALEQRDMRGPVNLTAPEPVRARDFARALGRTLRRRAWLAVPTPLVRMDAGAITDILVRGKRVIPVRGTALGYQFGFPDLDPALRDLLNQSGPEMAAREAS